MTQQTFRKHIFLCFSDFSFFIFFFVIDNFLKELADPVIAFGIATFVLLLALGGFGVGNCRCLEKGDAG